MRSDDSYDENKGNKSSSTETERKKNSKKTAQPSPTLRLMCIADTGWQVESVREPGSGYAKKRISFNSALYVEQKEDFVKQFSSALQLGPKEQEEIRQYMTEFDVESQWSEKKYRRKIKKNRR